MRSLRNAMYALVRGENQGKKTPRFMRESRRAALCIVISTAFARTQVFNYPVSKVHIPEDCLQLDALCLYGPALIVGICMYFDVRSKLS